MKVKISYTVEATDEFRKAIRAYIGEPGMATRDEIKNWYEARGFSDNDDMMWEWGVGPNKWEQEGK